MLDVDQTSVSVPPDVLFFVHCQTSKSKKRWMEPVCLAGNLIMALLFIKKMYKFTVNIKWFTHQRMTERESIVWAVLPLLFIINYSLCLKTKSCFYWLRWSFCAWENDDSGNHCFCGLLRLASWIIVCTNCIFVTMAFNALLLSASPFLHFSISPYPPFSFSNLLMNVAPVAEWQ